MDKGRLGLTMLACACSVALVGAMVEQALAAPKKAKEQAPPVISAKSSKPLPEQTRKPTIPITMKSVAAAVPERQLEVLQKQAKQTPTESKMTGRKGHRQVKLSKKIPSKAVVQPSTDLMYYGLLESPQRYDPRRNHRGAGVPDPETPELTHDHFQELDRNQDGKIDPVERAFGRLDMDRDLHDRQPR